MRSESSLTVKQVIGEKINGYLKLLRLMIQNCCLYILLEKDNRSLLDEILKPITERINTIEFNAKCENLLKSKDKNADHIKYLFDREKSG